MPKGNRTNHGTDGRKPLKFTDEQRELVQTHSGLGMTHEDIADFMGIERNTLEKHFKKELREGKYKANALVSKSLFRNAVENNNPSAQIWWEKTRAGKREIILNEISGKDGAPIRHEDVGEAKKLVEGLSKEMLIKLIVALDAQKPL